ncbi:MAG: tRNA uridine-5-carboxymethylaminomethyl(34) synthesis GTPase MnmE [Bacteroidales bacterium]|nr:tRNA uridine-5-carboxymethylaminomethyl(34) synthesis GTPase MnmE [Bacteroidales bacterium]
MGTGTFNPQNKDTICALSTATGSGAIAVIRLSGESALDICRQVFTPSNPETEISGVPGYTLHLGYIRDGKEVIDQVVAGVFRAPNSYTGEDLVEFSCHGSAYIQQKIPELLIHKGARMAKPGEFTLRAFLNGKYDLSQAEAVADLIAAGSRVSHDMALRQMRGEFSKKINHLRQELVDLASLLELELDFSEEDVEFASRQRLQETLDKTITEVNGLVKSFAFGNVLRKGVPVAITGKPNVGKSTLLNALLNEDRAIVSEIPGTTRDTIEDILVIDGVAFRFIDTAGLRTATDKVENLGIERTYEKIRQASVILYVFDVTASDSGEVKASLAEFREYLGSLPEEAGKDRIFIPVANKTDLLVEAPRHFGELVEMECIFVSAKRKENISLILEKLSGLVKADAVTDMAIVTNIRHHEALTRALESLEKANQGIREGLPADLVAADLRGALHYLGEITGEITTHEILGNIFSRFCIGK